MRCSKHVCSHGTLLTIVIGIFTGLISEFDIPDTYNAHVDVLVGNTTTVAAATVSMSCDEQISDNSAYHWRLFNGVWSLVLALGLVWSTMLLRKARHWNFFKGPIRNMLADYSTFLMVVAWTAISYAPSNLPEGIPRRQVSG